MLSVWIHYWSSVPFGMQRERNDHKIPGKLDKCRGWNPDRSLNTELALKDVYNKKRLYSAIGFEKEKERTVLNTVS